MDTVQVGYDIVSSPSDRGGAYFALVFPFMLGKRTIFQPVFINWKAVGCFDVKLKCVFWGALINCVDDIKGGGGGN